MKVISHSYKMVSCLLVGLAAGIAHAEGWNPANDPTILENNFDTTFEHLPTTARLSDDHMPWTDTYWPSNRGSIAYRWNSKDPIFTWQDPRIKANPAIFHYHSPTKEEAHAMSQSDLAQLSPTEKFDLFRGDYGFWLTHKVLEKSSPDAEYWEGICHGWSPASVNHVEPAPVTLTSPDGIQIPFGSADVKALLDYYYAVSKGPTRQMGRRCYEDLHLHPELANTPDCADTNAGAFHITLANYIGLRHESFIADIDRGIEIWNNPVFEYTSQIIETSGPAATSAAGTASRVHLTTVMHYASDSEAYAPQWDATIGTPQYREEQAYYDYWLDLDGAHKIIGGDWNTYDRPDFIWMKKKLEFKGKFKTILEIYHPAR